MGPPRSVLGRGLAVLGAFTDARPELTLGDIVASTGLPSATAYRIVAELVDWGALERVRRGRYRVGMKLWQVGSETPSSRPDLHRLIPARRPLGFLSAAMGGLGFALPAAIGVRMAWPRVPVVAVVGDGSSLYAIQALWSAAHYRVGVLFVVLANGRYAIMDRLAEEHGGGAPPWPAFPEVSVSGVAQALGCPALRVADHDAVLAALDEHVPGLADRRQPLVLDVAVATDAGLSVP